jgi:hypothetical protein
MNPHKELCLCVGEMFKWVTENDKEETEAAEIYSKELHFEMKTR